MLRIGITPPCISCCLRNRRCSARPVTHVAVSAPPSGRGRTAMVKTTPLGENRLLERLSADERAALQPNLKKFDMVLGTVLHPPATPIEHVYFPLSGMVSLLAVMKTG